MASTIRGADNFDSGVIDGFGVGQTWQDVTASRSAGVTYTNTTGRPIVAELYFHSPSAGAIRGMTVDGITYKDGSNASWVDVNLTKIIPNNSTYSVSNIANLITWSELR